LDTVRLSENEESLDTFRLGRILERVVKLFSHRFADFSVLVLLGMVCMVVLDVLLRATVRLHIPGNIELVSVMLILVFYGGIAYTEVCDEHIKVNVITDKFSQEWQLAIRTVSTLIVLIIIAIISWQSVNQSLRLSAQYFQTKVLGIPLGPFALLTAVFMGLFCLVLLVKFVRLVCKLLEKGKLRGCLKLVPGVVVAFVLLSMMIWPSAFPLIKVDSFIFALIALLLMFGLIFFGVHIGAAMAIATLWGASYVAHPGAGMAILGAATQSVASNYTWSVVPLFILMGVLVSEAGLGRDLYSTSYKWLGHVAGGLAAATVAACGAFAAVVGDPLSGAIAVGKISLPEMREYRYDTKLAVASIATGSTIGVLIPPSLCFIVYGIMTEQSIGRLFAAGIFPGILMVVALVLLIVIRCHINPQLGPPGPAVPLKAKFISLKYSWAVLFLFLVVIGGIYVGIFTANEAGAIGAFCALLFALLSRRVTFIVCW